MKKISKITLIVAATLSAFFALAACTEKKLELSKTELADKIKGGWAGQIIGCTYGGPTEWKYQHRTMPDSEKIKWDENRPITSTIFGGLYDDLYLDITFMDVFERFGFDAPRAEFQKAVGESTYELWAANRALRFAWLDGFQRGEPTSWKINPMYNDIDFQIESDYAGLMSPAMPNVAVKFAEPAGRSINSNDGFYCGAYVAAMYSIAFVSNDMEFVVVEAMKVLPAESRMRKIASDVVKWHGENPNDWKYAWQKIEDNYVRKHDFNYGAFAIHAPYNCAYILVGLLYGGDFEKTMEIAMRCGLDSDCNPASACGILGASMGYSKIPAKFKKRLEACDDKLFMGTSYSPKKVYETGLKQALAALEANGAKFDGDKIIVPLSPIREMPLEEDAPSADKVSRKIVSVKFADSTTFEFEGVGVTLTTSPEFNKAFKDFAETQKEKGAAGEIEISLDGKKIRTAKFFADKHLNERDFLFSARGLPNGKHKLEFKLANAKKGFPEFFGYLRIYSEKK